MSFIELAWEVISNGLMNERNEFKREICETPATNVYKYWYRIGFYEEYFEMLMTDYAEEHLSDNEVEWMANMIDSGKNFLAFLYEEWLSADGAFSHDWDEMMDFIHTVYDEEEEER